MTIAAQPTELTSDAARLGRLERKMAVVEHRVREIEERLETVPTRVTKLEQQFEHMAGQLLYAYFHSKVQCSRRDRTSRLQLA